MKTNYLTLFFIVATFAIILTLFYFITKDVFYYPSKIKAGNKIDEVLIGDQVWKSTNLELDTFRNRDLIPQVESDKAWVKAGGAKKGDEVWKSKNFDLDTFRDGDLIPQVESDEASVKAGGANPSPIPTPVENKMTDIDGNQYDVIKIGNQIWMKENLKVSKYRNGEAIPTGLVNSAWANTNKGAYAIYNNENANNNIYGKLYNWYAVNDSRGLCPTGWHVPGNSEWSTLISYLGGESVAGGKLKSTGIYYWNSPNSNATNVSGFSALPGGYLSGNGNFNYRLSDAVFWSANENFTFNAWYFYLHYYNGNMGSSSNVKQNGYSVRCLKD